MSSAAHAIRLQAVPHRPDEGTAATASDATGVTGWVVGLMETLGAPGAGAAIALESVFPPLPSELFLPLAGFAAHQGDMSLAAAIVWTTLGSVVGAVALYYLGMALGRERVRAIADRMPLAKVDDVDRAERWFARHGRKAVFLGRMVPLVRSLISIPAGIERMPMATFLTLTAAGSLIWNTALIMAGYLLGTQWHVVERYAGIATTVVLIGAGLAVAWLVVARVRQRHKSN